jgi:hypothetical protein
LTQYWLRISIAFNAVCGFEPWVWVIAGATIVAIALDTMDVVGLMFDMVCDGAKISGLA